MEYYVLGGIVVSEDRRMFCFNNEKEFITEPIKLEFGFLDNIIKWAKEDLYKWADKNMEESKTSCSVIEFLQYRGDYLEQYLNQSLVLNIYAILENGLKRLSEFYENKIDSNIKISDFQIAYRYDGSKRNVSSLEKYASYLKKIGVRTAKDKNYKILLKWNLVRNCIVHAGYEIKDEKKVKILKEIVKIDEVAKEVSSYSVIIDFGSLEKFIKTVQKYLTTVFDYKISSLKLKPLTIRRL